MAVADYAGGARRGVELLLHVHNLKRMRTECRSQRQLDHNKLGNKKFQVKYMLDGLSELW